MNKHLRRTLTAGLMVLGLGMWGSKAQAASSDTIVVNVTPNVTYAVQITSPMTGGYQFGQQSLSATTLSTSGIGVKNNGNVAEYFSPSIANSAPGNWAPQNGAPGADQYQMRALLTNTNAEPDSSLVSENLAVNPLMTVATHYGNAAKTSAGTTHYLWLQLTMPSDLVTSNGQAQTMVLTINGQGS